MGYAGVLAQLHKDFTLADGRKLEQITREDLQKAGVHVVATPSKVGTRRRHFAWANKSFNVWAHGMRQRGMAISEAAARAKRVELLEERALMSEDERRASLDAFGLARAAPPLEELDQMLVDSGLAELRDNPRGRKWTYHTSELPFDPELLAQAKGDNKAAESCGYASRAQGLRWSMRDKLFVPDTGEIPPEKAFDIRLTCSQAHPGICHTADRAVYADALAMARIFERFFVTEKLRRYFAIFDPNLPCNRHVVWFGHQRARRPHAQVTKVFVRCLKEDAGLPV